MSDERDQLPAETHRALVEHGMQAIAPVAAAADAAHDARVDAHEQPLVEHLVELRARLLRIVLAVLLAFVPLFYFANDLYQFVAAPLMAALPKGSQMIATEVASPFVTPFKLAIYASLFLTIPYSLHQIWAFIAPGLYSKEKRFGAPLLASSVLLFYAGGAFAYYVVFPFIFVWFVGTAPDGVTVMTDINHYLDFALGMFFAFGATFEIPVAVFLLVRTGITSAKALAEKRPFVIVGCFVLGAIFTPPDVVSQLMMAVPMWLLFELGLVVCRLTIRPATT